MTRALDHPASTDPPKWIGSFGMPDIGGREKGSAKERAMIEAASRMEKRSTSRHRFYKENRRFCETPIANRVMSSDGRFVASRFIIYELDDEDSEGVRWATVVWDAGTGEKVFRLERGWSKNYYSMKET